MMKNLAWDYTVSPHLCLRHPAVSVSVPKARITPESRADMLQCTLVATTRISELYKEIMQF